MARTRFYIGRLFPWCIHFTDFSHPAVYVAVVQAGGVESQRSIEKVLVAVVLVAVLQIVKEVKMC
jgi:hypothetical protein